MRCDDSVVRVVDERRIPDPALPRLRSGAAGVAEASRQHTLACGGELKNTFCVAKERHAFLSHHIGDLENYETLRSFREGIEHYCRLFDVRPEPVAYDLHPEYLSTKYALELEEVGAPGGRRATPPRPRGELPGGQRAPGRESGDRGGAGRDRLRDRRGRLGRGVPGGERSGGVRAAGAPGVRPHARRSSAIRQPWRMALAHLIAPTARKRRRAAARDGAAGGGAERAARRPARGARVEHPADLQRGPALRRRGGAGRCAGNPADHLRGTGRHRAGAGRARSCERRIPVPVAAGGRRLGGGDPGIIGGVVEDLLAGRDPGNIFQVPPHDGRGSRRGLRGDPGSRRGRTASRSPGVLSRTCCSWSRW